MKPYPEKRLSRPSTGFDLERIADNRPEPAEELDAKLSLLLIGMMLSGDALTLYKVAMRMAAGEGLNPERYTPRQLRATHYRLCMREGVTRWRYYAAMPEAAKAVSAVLRGR